MTQNDLRLYVLPFPIPIHIPLRNLPKKTLNQTDLLQLGQATCIACGSKVQYLGIVNHSPKYRCRYCRRTSDGCQTYEGHHKIYQRCAVQSYWLDCGRFNNNHPVSAQGPCPVCGKKRATLGQYLQHQNQRVRQFFRSQKARTFQRRISSRVNQLIRKAKNHFNR